VYPLLRRLLALNEQLAFAT